MAPSVGGERYSETISQIPLDFYSKVSNVLPMTDSQNTQTQTDDYPSEAEHRRIFGWDAIEDGAAFDRDNPVSY